MFWYDRLIYEDTYKPPVGSQVLAIFWGYYEMLIQLQEPDGYQVYVAIPREVVNLPVQRYSAEDALPLEGIEL